MRRTMFIVITGALVLATTVAMATDIVTRAGVEYSGIRNPGNCEVLADGADLTELHVKCTTKAGGSGPDGAYVRYRFLSDVGGTREPATVSSDIATFVGADCFAEWMVKSPQKPARTLRVTVPWGSYCHIRSVTWSQP
jgi:hypothetical protein